MRGMEVHLNGKKLCTAGIGANAVSNTIVDVNDRGNDWWMMVRVGGLENGEFLIWARNELAVGDESESGSSKTSRSMLPSSEKRWRGH